MDNYFLTRVLPGKRMMVLCLVLLGFVGLGNVVSAQDSRLGRRNCRPNHRHRSRFSAWFSVVFTILALSVSFRSVAQEHKFIDLKNNKAELSDGPNLLCHDVFEIRIAITNAEGLR